MPVMAERIEVIDATLIAESTAESAVFWVEISAKRRRGGSNIV
jgi:hypothetical protein